MTSDHAAVLGVEDHAALEAMSPVTFPMYSSGTVMTTFMMGSSRTGHGLGDGLAEGEACGLLERDLHDESTAVRAVDQLDRC